MDLKNVAEDISQDIVDATKTLFETMIMMDLKFNKVQLASETHVKSDVAALVSFMGKYHGIIGVFCSKDFSLKVASSMLMEEMTEFTTEVIDGIGELSNMIAGNVKTKIAADYGEMELSIPMVLVANNKDSSETDGKLSLSNSFISCFTSEPWLFANFSVENDNFDIGLLLKESVQV